MLPLQIASGPGNRLKILCIGAHPDDIEIGCGATILGLLERFPRAEVFWVVLSGDSTRAVEAESSANTFLDGADQKSIKIQSFRDGYFPSAQAEIKDFFESALKDFDPDVIFTHRQNDKHQDHRVVSELTWNTFRHHLIFEYEILKYDGDLGQPSVFFSVSESNCDKKVDAIYECFESQQKKHWFSKDAFRSIMRIRGVESASPTKYAEAFYARKVVFE